MPTPLGPGIRAVLTARVGALRVGAFRVGFIPRNVRNAAGTASAGPFYAWSRVYPATTTWTAVKR